MNLLHFSSRKVSRRNRVDLRRDSVPDIAVWLQEPSSVLGNQLLIEIKRGNRQNTDEKGVANQLRQYLSNVDAKAGVLLWQFATDKEETRIYPGYPTVFSLSLPSFIEMVDSGQLVSTLVASETGKCMVFSENASSVVKAHSARDPARRQCEQLLRAGLGSGRACKVSLSALARCSVF